MAAHYGHSYHHVYLQNPQTDEIREKRKITSADTRKHFKDMDPNASSRKLQNWSAVSGPYVTEDTAP